VVKVWGENVISRSESTQLMTKNKIYRYGGHRSIAKIDGDNDVNRIKKKDSSVRRVKEGECDVTF